MCKFHERTNSSCKSLSVLLLDYKATVTINMAYMLAGHYSVSRPLRISQNVEAGFIIIAIPLDPDAVCFRLVLADSPGKVQVATNAKILKTKTAIVPAVISNLILKVLTPLALSVSPAMTFDSL